MGDPACRPALAPPAVDLAQYDTVLLGFPIWWYVEPRIVDTFLESQDFSGKTVIPFCTSASSGASTSSENLAELAGSGNWLECTRFASGVDESGVAEWLAQLEM